MLFMEEAKKRTPPTERRQRDSRRAQFHLDLQEAAQLGIAQNTIYIILK